MTSENKKTMWLGIGAFIGMLAIFGPKQPAHTASGGSYQNAGNKTNPTCNSDWHRCADNADLNTNYSKITDGRASCMLQSEKLAKYGSPTFPSVYFSTFLRGDADVKTGVATFIETDAQFSNAFGAMVHSTVVCRYDLNRQEVLDVAAAPR
jgi:hypothetical protein